VPPIPLKLFGVRCHHAGAPRTERRNEPSQLIGKRGVRSKHAQFANAKRPLFWLPAPGLFFDHVLERAILQ